MQSFPFQKVVLRILGLVVPLSEEDAGLEWYRNSDLPTKCHPLKEQWPYSADTQAPVVFLPVLLQACGSYVMSANMHGSVLGNCARVLSGSSSSLLL